MAINLKNKLVEEQIRELARITGETVTEAIGKAVDQRIKVIGSRASNLGVKEAILSIGTECSKLPDLSNASTEEILGYSSEGLFK